MKTLYLYTHETGVPNLLNVQSDLYALCGCIISEDKRESLEETADKIKIKYWNKKSVQFHSSEIARNLGLFSVFKGKPKLKTNFYKDLYCFLNSAPIIILPVILDKTLARKRKWGYDRVLRTISRKIFRNFILYTLSRARYKGKIIVEISDPTKDLYYIKAFTHFSERGIPEAGIQGIDIRKNITSLSFVTKQNEDIEEQVADLFAYAAKSKYEMDIKGKIFPKNSYEMKISSILKSKLHKIHPNTGRKKRRLLREIDSFAILP